MSRFVTRVSMCAFLLLTIAVGGSAQEEPTPRLFYELDGDGPVIVLIPDWAHDTSSWLRVLPHLRSDFQLLRYDLRGQGRSEASSDGRYALDRHRDDLGRVVNGLGVERAHLVAAGFGARVALAYAQENPDRVASIVLVEPMLASSDEELVWWNRLLRAYDQVGSPSLGEYTSLLVDRWFGTTFIEFNRWVADFYDLMLRRQNPVPLMASIRWWLSVDLELGEAPSVTVPVLILRSDRGELRGEDALREVFPRLRHRRIDARGTVPQISAPEEVARRLAEFVSEIEREEPPRGAVN